MVIPHWISHLINHQSLKNIEEQISMIENESDVEIVPVIVKDSKISLSLFLPVLGFTFLCLSYLAFIFYSIQTTWNHDFMVMMSRPITFIFLTVSLLYIYFLIKKASFISKFKNMNSEERILELCKFSANKEFDLERLQDVQKKNGILFFISLEEHQVIIKPDENIQSKFNDNELWKEEINIIITSILKNDLGEGLLKALKTIQPILKEKFPLTSKKINILSNKVIIKS